MGPSRTFGGRRGKRSGAWVQWKGSKGTCQGWSLKKKHLKQGKKHCKNRGGGGGTNTTERRPPNRKEGEGVTKTAMELEKGRNFKRGLTPFFKERTSLFP